MPTPAQQIRESYREAVASAIEGTDNFEAWGCVYHALAKAILSAWLASAAKTAEDIPECEVTKILYAKEGSKPKINKKHSFAKKPDAFDELFEQFDIKPDFEVAPNLQALADLEGRVPMVRVQVPEVEGMAWRLAEEVVAAERANIIPIMEKSSKAMQSGLRRAFWVSDVDAETVINLQELLADAIRGVMPDKTLSLPEFIDHAKLEGALNLTDARLETIFRTNVMTAANEGVMSVLRDDDAKDLYPLVMISEIDDDRSRPHHALMDGYMTTPGEMDRLQLRPPNGYNCRGNLIKVTWDEANDMGLLDDAGNVDMVSLRKKNEPEQEALIVAGIYPDKGFKRGGGLL